MKNEKLLEAFGKIGDSFITDAAPAERSRNRFEWKRWGSVAACLALATALSVGIGWTATHGTPIPPPTDGDYPHYTGPNNVEGALGIEDLQGQRYNFSGPGYTVSFAPDPDGEPSDLEKALREIWCGDYYDENDNYIIVLTEDTPENRAIYKEVFNPNEDYVTYREGTELIAYINGLAFDLRCIDFPFVAGIKVDEDNGLVVVTVTTKDESNLRKLLDPAYYLSDISSLVKFVHISGQELKTPSVEPVSQVSDAPAQELPNIDGSLIYKYDSTFRNLYGGSYINDEGQYVVIITDDTPENRAAVCSSLYISEKDVTFREGKYPLEYLTELQRKISEGMVSKEFDFISTSSLREDFNIIVVQVTTNDEAKWAKLLALDPTGGAIKIGYDGDGSINHELGAVITGN